MPEPARGNGRIPLARISATAAAREAIRRLRAARGEDLMFVQSAGCCAGSVPMCFPAGEFVVGDLDLLLGEIEGCPFYIDARIYQSWDYPQLVLDIAPGDPEGFSLGPGGGLHFVTTPGPGRKTLGRRGGGGPGPSMRAGPTALADPRWPSAGSWLSGPAPDQCSCSYLNES